MVKPGYKTSEFWFTLVTFIFSGLYLLGVIGDIQQKDELISNVSHAVESCILIGGQLMVLYKYIKGRTEVKKAFWGSTTVVVEEKEEKKDVKKPRARRSSKAGRSNQKKLK